MIKKTLLMIAAMLMLPLLVLSAAKTEYAQSIPVSFTFNIEANYGFAKKKVLGYIKPDGIDDVYFKLDRRTGTMKTNQLWMYYQVFTTDQVTFTLELQDLQCEGKKPIKYKTEDIYSVNGNSSEIVLESGNQYTLLTKKADKPYFDSFNVVFVVDDLSDIDWSAEYTASVKMKLETRT